MEVEMSPKLQSEKAARASGKVKAPAPAKRGRPSKDPPHSVEELREEAEELREAISGLGPDEAKALLNKLVPAREEIDILKAERREEAGKVTDAITAIRGQIDRKLEHAKAGMDEQRHKVTAEQALAVIDRHWRRLSKLEEERMALRKAYGKKLKAVEKRYRDILDGICQLELPFSEKEAAA
jgi:hypothetical protein